ncbi:tetratricopeptide repeat protein [Croceitalea marina]|uniref:Tetratricopeptide repeat protein n=1 Tax=Croceitalea marina TaxID=1775166 RepID=A0ABW5MVC4_9FLAO
MPNHQLPHFIKSYRHSCITLLIAFLLLFCPTLKAQDIPEDFKEKVRDLIKDAPKSYGELDTALKRSKRDTTLLTYFLEEAKSNNYLEGQTYALNQLGTAFRNLSQLEKAIILHEKGLAIAEEIESTDFKILSLNMLGVVYRRKDAIQTALGYNQQALEIAETVSNKSKHVKRSINVALNSIGNLYQTLGQYDLAISQFKRALELERELSNKLGLAINNQNIGDCYEQKGELEEALQYYRKSLAYNEDINSDYGRVICKNSIARIYTKQGMPNAALVIFEPLQKQALKIGDNFISSSVFINTGHAQTSIGEYQKAKKNISYGLQLAEESNMPALIIAAKRFLSSLAEKTGNYKEALKYQKEAESFENTIVNQRNLNYISEITLQYDNEKKNSEIESLAQENELSKIRLRKNQTTILVAALTLGLIGTMLFIMYRKYHSDNEKKVLSLEQNMLRSQMNPHFLFNSLNSIKLYIINNDKKNAVHYLNKFSKLVRRILEGSSLKEISLAEEIETAELYLNIENIRFSEEIKFEIDVAKEIDSQQVKIPSLVLQPFLENAIWHGLSSKEGEKRIWLNVYNYDKYHIAIDVIDNGVGRNASEKIKENRVLKRKSVGIDITTERLANFSKDYENDFEVAIEDLKDETGGAAGTKITLKIPTI